MEPHAPSALFLTGGGAMGERIRRFDWSRSPLGPAIEWPARLQTLMSVVLGSNQAMLLVWGPQRIMLYNDAYAVILGDKHPAALGRSFTDVWQEIQEVIGPMMDRAYAGEPTQREDLAVTLIRRGFPETAHFAFSFTPIRDASRAVTGVFVACMETTATMRAQQALIESEQRFRMTSLATNDLLYEWHVESGDVQWNEALQRVLGYPSGQFGHIADWEDAVHPDDRQRVIRDLHAALDGGAESWSNEYRFRKRDGSYAVVLDRGYIARDEGGKPVRMIGSMHDVTERHRSEQALRASRDQLEQRVRERTIELQHRADQLARLTSQLTLTEHRERRRLAKVLHDHLQQLLVGARFRLGVVARHAPDKLRGELAEVASLLSDSIRASRSLTVELSPPILHEGGLAAGIAWLARVMEEKHGLHVTLSLDDKVHIEREDVKLLLFEAVRELLFNVFKHAGVKEASVAMARHDADRLRIVVRDRGRGFDPNRTLTGDDATHGGYGLFSVRERLEFLGGEFIIESASGKGARFTLIAPLRAEDAEPAVVATAVSRAKAMRRLRRHAQQSGSGNIRVLLVDDHAVMRQGLSALLESEGDIEIVGEAADGAMAVDMARQLSPDVILMDFSMPHMDGVEATRIIHAEQPQTRIIGLSMYDEADRAKAMLAAGASAYVTKTGQSEELLAAIRSGEADARHAW